MIEITPSDRNYAHAYLTAIRDLQELTRVVWSASIAWMSRKRRRVPTEETDVAVHETSPKKVGKRVAKSLLIVSLYHVCVCLQAP